MTIKTESFPFHLGNLHFKLSCSEIKRFLEAVSDLLAPNRFSRWLVCFHRCLSLEEPRAEPGRMRHLVAWNHQMNPTVRVGPWAGGIVLGYKKKEAFGSCSDSVGVLAWAFCPGTFNSIDSSSLHCVYVIAERTAAQLTEV